MNLYHCMVELKNPDRSLVFAAAANAWLGHLEKEKLIRSWRLLRRKFGLAAGAHTDFIIEIEVESMAALEDTFSSLGNMDEQHTRRFGQLHDMIATKQIGLYRPYPDPAQRESIALI